MDTIQEVKVRLEGLTPIMMHNGQLADPLNKFVKAAKPYSSKRGKTEEDYAVLAYIEWWGGLYTAPGTPDIDTTDGVTITAPEGMRLVRRR